MSFDPQSFLDMNVEGENSTVAVPVPEGDFVAVTTKVEVRQWVGKADPTKSGVTLEVHWEIDDAEVRELLGRDKVTVRQGIMLDLTESGGLDMGKGRNVGLGKLRAALDLNNPGQVFSFNQIPGRAGRIQVKHRIDGDNIYAEVKGVAKM